MKVLGRQAVAVKRMTAIDRYLLTKKPTVDHGGVESGRDG
jgi:hypothetical protein